MRIRLLMFIVLAPVWAAFAQSEYAAKVTLNTGQSFVVPHLDVQGERLMRTGGTSSVALSMVESIEFRFTGVSLSMCESMFSHGDRKALEGVLEQSIGPAAQFCSLPTNLGPYLLWWLRCQFWNGSQAGAGRTIGYIRQTGRPELIDAAGMYFVLMLLDQDKPENARTVWESVADPAAVSKPMTAYIQGRLALEAGDPQRAMRYAAELAAFYRRDEEWMPPATLLEAQIYQKMGQPLKAAAAAEELILAYPDSQWSEQGRKIKMESTGTGGG